jgi:hypothetical protein
MTGNIAGRFDYFFEGLSYKFGEVFVHKRMQVYGE